MPILPMAVRDAIWGPITDFDTQSPDSEEICYLVVDENQILFTGYDQNMEGTVCGGGGGGRGRGRQDDPEIEINYFYP